jgi:hypothetical protein
MSVQKQIIEVWPAESGYVDFESAELRRFPCPSCNGRGWNRDWEAGRDAETDQIPCERCAETGFLRAKVMIRWGADV